MRSITARLSLIKKRILELLQNGLALMGYVKRILLSASVSEWLTCLLE